MASYSSTENIMLTGQVAYFKKNGSEINYGTVERQNALTAYSLSEGYIGPNSILYGTDLASTSEYTECEADMQDYLGMRWEENQNERTIITNSNNIKNRLLFGETFTQTLANAVINESE